MIGFAGLSHLGIVSGIAAAKHDSIIAFDPDAQLCEQLGRRELPIVEPGLPELLGEVQANIGFTADAAALARCDLIYVALDVATDDDNRVQLEPLRVLIEQVLAVASPQSTLVVLSQVPPGFTRELARRMASLPQAGPALYYQVETLIFGQAVQRALHPERFIIGCDNPQAGLAEALQAFLASFACPILPMRYESAELAKISINTCLVAAVSVANTLAELCESIGADWGEIAPALRLDKRIGQHAYIGPGLGLAGGNLERDLATISSLAKEHGSDAGVVESFVASSRHRRNWVLRQLHTQLGPWREPPHIALWGLAYKAGTAATKNAVTLSLLEELRGWPVRLYDPEAKLTAERPGVTQVATALEAARDADALAVVTPWPEFASQDLAALRAAMRGDLLIDPFGILPREQCLAAGFRYFRLGAPVG